MIGTEGWIVEFEVSGADRVALEGAINERLRGFAPDLFVEGSDKGWRLDVRSRPLVVEQSTGTVQMWEADVMAQLVTLRSDDA